MSEVERQLSAQELAAETGTALPDKEVLSLLNLNANLDLALAAAAPIDLAVGANANVAAPIDAAVGSNVLSPGSAAIAASPQHATLQQGIDGSATAISDQHSGVTQGSAPTTPATSGAPAPTGTSAGSGGLLDVNVNLDGKLNLAAPINGAVAANANAAAPIDAAVSANVGSPLATSIADAHQDVAIDQSIHGSATAVGTQAATVDQGTAAPATTTPTP